MTGEGTRTRANAWYSRGDAGRLPMLKTKTDDMIMLTRATCFDATRIGWGKIRDSTCKPGVSTITYLDPFFFGLIFVIVLGEAAIDGQFLPRRCAVLTAAGGTFSILNLVPVHLGYGGWTRS